MGLIYAWMSVGWMLLSLFSSDSRVLITDMAAWKHPTKEVFARRGIEVRQVELINKTYAIFRIAFPQTAATCDTASLNNALREVSRANGYWTYTLIDSSTASTFLKVVVHGDPKAHKVQGIEFVVRPACLSEAKVPQHIASEFGEVELLSGISDPDKFWVQLKLDRAVAAIESEDFELDTLVEIRSTLAHSPYAIFLATFSGPGLNCHEKFQLVQLDPKGPVKHSPWFGSCNEIDDFTRRGDTVVVHASGVVDAKVRTVYRWVSGKWSETAK